LTLPVLSHPAAVTGGVIMLVLCLVVLAVFGLARWRRRYRKECAGTRRANLDARPLLGVVLYGRSAFMPSRVAGLDLTDSSRGRRQHPPGVAVPFDAEFHCRGGRLAAGEPAPHGVAVSAGVASAGLVQSRRRRTWPVTVGRGQIGHLGLQAPLHLQPEREPVSAVPRRRPGEVDPKHPQQSNGCTTVGNSAIWQTTPERTFVPENRAAAPTIEPPPASAWQDAAAAFGLRSSTARLHLLWELARAHSRHSQPATRVSAPQPIPVS
jgi:hypothetical protein